VVTTGLTLAAAPVDRDMGSEMSHRLAADGNESRHHRTDVIDAAPLGRLSRALVLAAAGNPAVIGRSGAVVGSISPTLTGYSHFGLISELRHRSGNFAVQS
jgi:hypothetical protein